MRGRILLLALAMLAACGGDGNAPPDAGSQIRGFVGPTPGFVPPTKGGTGGGGSTISGLTTNTVTKATSSSTIGNSSITDDGTQVLTSEKLGVGNVSTPAANIDTRINIDATTTQPLILFGNNFTGQNFAGSIGVDSAKAVHFGTSSANTGWKWDNSVGAAMLALSSLGNLAVTGTLTADGGTRVFDTVGTGLARDGTNANQVDLSMAGGTCAAGNVPSALSSTGSLTCTAIGTQGGTTGTGTATDLAVWSSTTGLGNFAGSSPTACAAGTVLSRVVSAATGAITLTCTAIGTQGGVTGSGTSGTGTRWTGTTAIGNASFTDDGSTLTAKGLADTIESQAFATGAGTLTIAATASYERVTCTTGDAVLTIATPTVAKDVDLTVVVGPCTFTNLVQSGGAANLIVYAGESVHIAYDLTSAAWRVIASGQAVAHVSGGASLTSGLVPVASSNNQLTDGSWADTGSSLTTSSAVTLNGAAQLNGTVTTGSSLTTIGAGGIDTTAGAHKIGETEYGMTTASNGTGTLTDVSFARTRGVWWTWTGAGTLDGFGFTSGTPLDGQRFEICVLGAGSLSLPSENASETTAGRRFNFAPSLENVVIRGGTCRDFIYDLSATRWRSADGYLSTNTLGTNAILKQSSNTQEVTPSGFTDNGSLISTTAESLSITANTAQQFAGAFGYAGAAQTIAKQGIAVSNTGTYNTTAGTITATGGLFTETNTVSSGTNVLTSIALEANNTSTATATLTAIALQTDNGDVKLANTTGNVTIGAGSSQTLTVNAGGVFANTLAANTGNVSLAGTSGTTTIGAGGGAVQLGLASTGATLSIWAPTVQFGDTTATNASHWLDKDGTSRPVPSLCGTSPSIVGNDNSGVITVGTGGASSCTITWHTAYSANYGCVFVSRASGSFTSVAFTTTTAVLTKALNSGEKIDYQCADH